MGVRPREVDTSFCTETEIIEESAILRPEEEEEEAEEGAVEREREGESRVHKAHFRLEPPCNSRDISECSEDDEDYNDTGDAGRSHGVRGCLRSRPCSVCLYLFLVLLLLSSIVSILVVGLLVAAPYQNASSFVAARCTPTTLIIERQLRKCSCGKGCNSKYPCLKVKVTYTDQTGRLRESTMADDESALYRQVRLPLICHRSRDLVVSLHQWHVVTKVKI